MSIYEYDEERHIRQEREDAWEEGRQEGRQEGHSRALRKVDRKAKRSAWKKDVRRAGSGL